MAAGFYGCSGDIRLKTVKILFSGARYTAGGRAGRVVLVALFFRDVLFGWVLQTNPTGSSGLGWLGMTCLQNVQSPAVLRNNPLFDAMV